MFCKKYASVKVPVEVRHVHRVFCSQNINGTVTEDKWCLWFLTMSQSFSASKEEVPDNEQEKGSEKEMTERVNEDAEMVWFTASFLIFRSNPHWNTFKIALRY